MAKVDQTDDISDINIVPLVDIILVVLIIFMVTAPALVKPSVKIQLPEAGAGDETETSLFQVAVTIDGRVLINNEEVDEDRARQLAKEESERNPETQAIIAADREVPHGSVIRALDWIKQGGIKKFAVTTDRPVGI